MLGHFCVCKCAGSSPCFNEVITTEGTVEMVLIKISRENLVYITMLSKKTKALMYTFKLDFYA